MDSLGSEVGQKMRSAIKAKLMELGCYVDDELPDYIMVMVANKRSRSQMEDDLQLFLRSDTEVFVEWLQQVLKKLKEVTITNPDVCGTFRELKRKAAIEIAECVIKKEKKEKKIKPEKKTRNVELMSQVKSITDEIPVQATKLVEKRNLAIRSQELMENKNESNKNPQSTNVIQVVNEDNFDIPSLAEVNNLEESQLELVENKIKEARHRIVLMKSDSEDEDFINLRADAEDLMGNELDKSNLINLETSDLSDKKKLKSQTIVSHKSVPKKSLSERLGSHPTNISRHLSKNNDRKITLSDLKHPHGRIRSSIQSIKKPVENKIRKRESVHKRLGLPSSVISLNKKEENEEEQPKSVMSVVQVKPRRNISGLCQANKNLLLKAVAEAQKSVTQTPLVGRQIKEKNICLVKCSEHKISENEQKITNNNVKSSKEHNDPKVQNIIIEVKRKKNRSEIKDSDAKERNGYTQVSADKNYDPIVEDNEYVQNAIDLTYEEDLDKFVEEFDESQNLEENINIEPETNHQFIVTLDGIKEKNLLECSENSEVEESSKLIKRPPSPIIFEKSEALNLEKTVMQVSQKLTKIHVPLLLKSKERCKYWPNCRLKEACEYVHPTTPCNMFPLCKFGDKCLYIHPKCKFDASCTRKECPYSHGSIKIPIKAVARPVSSYVTSQEVCKYHPNCSNPHCLFYHPKPCRFGKYCINKSECNFSHGKIPNKEKLTWHSNAR